MISDNVDDETVFTMLGGPRTGKTSLANALLGFNEEKDDSYNAALDLFPFAQGNDWGCKNGHLLGLQDRQKIQVVDNKSYVIDDKIDST